jgi:hypothetical protein
MAVIQSLSKLVAAGCDISGAWLSLQEFFESLMRREMGRGHFGAAGSVLRPTVLRGGGHRREGFDERNVRFDGRASDGGQLRRGDA